MKPLQTIHIVSKSIDNRGQYLRLLELDTDHYCHAFPTLEAALAHHTAPDFLLVDFSAIATPMNPDRGIEPICLFLQAYPECHVVINSTVSEQTTRDLVEDIKERKPAAKVYGTDCMDWEGTLSHFAG